MQWAARLGRRGAAGGLIGLVALVCWAAAPAQAGRAIMTGHDADLHCNTGLTPASDQCHYLRVAVDWVRGGAPDPSRPVLVLDRGPLQAVRALDKAYGTNVVPRVVADPRSPEFAAAALSTTLYSAIIVASDITCGGCSLNEIASTPDSDAIIARRADIETYFNEGGGILALAGAQHGDGPDPATDRYYGFLPIPVGGAAVAPPFSLTAEGLALGFIDGPGQPFNDVNCCRTHNSFELPAPGGALRIAETDGLGRAETLYAEGRISGGGFTPPGTTPAPAPPPPAPAPTQPVGPTSGPAGRPPPAFGPSGIITGLPSARKCVSRRAFRIRIRKRRGRTYESVVVFVNGRRVEVRRGRRTTAPVNLRGLPRGRFTVRITVITTNGEVIVGTRRYRTCTRKRPGGRPPL